MLFILRSTVCLGFVFWSIPPQENGRLVQNIAKAPTASIARAVDSYCKDKPAACLTIASQLASSGKDASIQSILATAAAMATPTADTRSAPAKATRP
jgi:hypothetical protein